MCCRRNAGVVDKLWNAVHTLTRGTRWGWSLFGWGCGRRLDSDALARRSDERLGRSAGCCCRRAAGVVCRRRKRGGDAGVLGFGGIGSRGGSFASPWCLACITGLLFLSFFHFFELAFPRLGSDVTRSIQGIHGGIFVSDFIKSFI